MISKMFQELGSSPYASSRTTGNEKENAFTKHFQDKNIKRYVRKFLMNIKKPVVKESVPKEAQLLLEPQQDTEDSDRSPLGWSAWRADVLMVDLMENIAHLAAIFFFSVRMVLVQAYEQNFPMIYLTALMLSAFYKLNSQVLIYDKTLVRKSAIRRQYYRRHLPIDLALALLCILEYLNVNSDVFRLMIFLKLIDVKNMQDKFQVLIRQNRTGLILWRLLSMFVVNILAAHVIALIVISMVDEEITPNWMSYVGLVKSDPKWTTPYVWAFYWGTTIMLTIGFGDLIPKNPKEALIIAFVEMLGVTTFAYYINAIHSLLVSLREVELNKQQNLSVINRYMMRDEVNPIIQSQVKKAVVQISDTTKISEVKEQNGIIATLVADVREKLLRKVNVNPLISMLFWNRMSMKTVERLAVALDRKIYYSSEVLVIEGDIPTKFMMLKEGHINSIVSCRDGRQIVVDQHIQKDFMKVKAFQWLLFNETIQQRLSPSTIKSSGHSIVMEIQLKDATMILKSNEEDYERYCQFRDQQMLELSEAHQKSCRFCPLTDHSLLQCPFFHYAPNRITIVAKYMLDKRAGKKRQKPLGYRKPRPKNNILKTKVMAPRRNVTQKRQSERTELIRASYTFVCEQISIDQVSMMMMVNNEPEVDCMHQWKLYYRHFNFSNLVFRPSIQDETQVYTIKIIE